MSKTYRELTGKEKRQIKKLVVSKCANYDKEYGCLPLSGTPKSRKTFWGEEEQRSERAFRACTETNDTKLVTTKSKILPWVQISPIAQFAPHGILLGSAFPKPCSVPQSGSDTANADFQFSKNKGGTE